MEDPNGPNEENSIEKSPFRKIIQKVDYGSDLKVFAKIFNFYKPVEMDINGLQKLIEEVQFVKNNPDEMSRLQRTIFDREDGDEEGIIEMIEELGPFCFPSHIDKTKSTVLMWACQKDMPTVANKLIDTFGELCVPGYPDRHVSTALTWCCCGTGDDERNKLMEQIAIKIVQTFNSGGKSVPIQQFYYTSCNPYQRDYFGFTALDLACREGMTDAALEMLNTFKPVRFNGFDGLIRNKQTLINACFNGMDEVVKQLMERFKHQIDPTVVDELNHSALYHAHGKCRSTTVVFLLRTYGEDCIVGDFENCQNILGQQFHDWYQQYKNWEYKAKLGRLGYWNLNDMTVLQRMIIDNRERGNDNEIVQQIRKWSTELDEELMNYLIGHVDNKYNTALILATFYGMDVVAIHLIKTFGQACKPEYYDHKGHAAIYYAYKRCSEDVVRLILDTFGEGCVGKFMDACSATKNGLLFKDWYQQYQQEKLKKTELEFIGQHEQMTRLEVAIETKKTQDEICQLIDELGDLCFIHHQCFGHHNEGWTILMKVCARGLTDVALKLIDKFGEKCNPGFVNETGWTALLWAAYIGDEVIITKLLDTFGSDCKPTTRNGSGDALNWATIKHLDNIVIRLVDNYYDFNTDKLGYKSYLLPIWTHCSTFTVEHMLDKYGLPDNFEQFDSNMNKDDITFKEWYEEYQQRKKGEAKKNELPKLMIHGRTLDSIEECGEFLQRLVTDPTNNSKEINMVMHFMKYLITC